jgi:hypothetical protein
MTVDLDGGNASYGGIASFLLNIGISPMFEFRTGVSAGGMHRGVSDQNSTQVTAVVPAMLGVNYTPWFSIWAGLAGGFMLVKGENLPVKTGGVVGPEWSVLTMRAGEKRQYELSFVQGLRFGNLPQEYHQAFSFTYLFLD